MTDTAQVTEVAKGISDFGVLVMIGAIYLILSASMMIAIFKWFKTIIGGIMEQSGKELREIMEAVHENNSMMLRILEGLRPETDLRIRNLSGFVFENAVGKVCNLIKTIREENHIADRETTAAKIRKSLTVLHDDRNSRLDTFTYGGVKLSAYTSPDWIEQVAKVVESEIYHEDGANDGRAFTNVKLAYDDIKTDFYKRLNS